MSYPRDLLSLSDCEDRYPNEVVVTEVMSPTRDGAATPSGEPGEDDFFSSWDKPTIKRPSNPPSRSQTPNISRTASPFLNAGSNGGPRAKSPASAGAASAEGSSAPTSALSAPRTTSSAAIRKNVASGAARKTNVLGAKKAPKLGAKKVGAAETIDFDEAEKKAKEEAERIAKLGYDPEAEEPPSATVKSPTEKTGIVSPTPLSPPKASFGATTSNKGHQRSQSELERLGMGMGRLGFGQSASSKPAPKKMGFGAVGPAKSAKEGKLYHPRSRISHITLDAEDEDEQYARQKFGTQKGISSDEFFGKGEYDPHAQSEAKTRLQGFEGATSISSNAYFGRPEEDNQPDEFGNYGDMEGAARDFIRKFGVTTADDLENLGQLVGEAGTKLQGAIRNYLNS
jgi:ADP-ribosylation factor GTPase-activating protein 2/3